MASVADPTPLPELAHDATTPTQKRERDTGEDAAVDPPSKKTDTSDDGDDNGDLAEQVEEAFEKAVGFKVDTVTRKSTFDAIAVFMAMRKADTERCLTGTNGDDVSDDHLHQFELRDIQNTVAAFANDKVAAFAVHVLISAETLIMAKDYADVALEYVEEAGLSSGVTAMEVADLEYMQLLAALGDIEEIKTYLVSLTRAVFYEGLPVEDVRAILARKRFILVIQ